MPSKNPGASLNEKFFENVRKSELTSVQSAILAKGSVFHGMIMGWVKHIKFAFIDRAKISVIATEIEDVLKPAGKMGDELQEILGIEKEYGTYEDTTRKFVAVIGKLQQKHAAQIQEILEKYVLPPIASKPPKTPPASASPSPSS